MSGRKLWLAAALALVAAPAFAERPEAQDGGGGARAAAGSRQQATGSSSAVTRGAAPAPGVSGPQARHPRAGTGTGGYYGYGRYGYYGHYPYYYRPYYGSRFYYPGFYSGLYWGSPYYYGGYYGPGYYAPGYGPPYYRNAGSVRLIVKPEETRVYVDGYYAGIVDDFDGIFQRLNLAPGRHEITLKLDGFRTHGFRVYVPIDQTLKIHFDMARGTGEDPTDVVGTPPENYREDQDHYTRRDYHAPVGPYAGDDRRDYPGDEDRYRDDRNGDDRYDNDRYGNDQGRDESVDDQDARIQDDRGAQGDAGTLRLDVRPDDASIYVDGAFRGTARDVAGVTLEPGHHRVEVVRPGFRTVEREVEIQAGGSQELNVDLNR